MAVHRTCLSQARNIAEKEDKIHHHANVVQAKNFGNEQSSTSGSAKAPASSSAADDSETLGGVLKDLQNVVSQKHTQHSTKQPAIQKHPPRKTKDG